MKKIKNIWQGILTELKLVEFPTRPETFKGTHLVIAISIFLGIFLILMDTLFNALRNYLTFNL